MKYEKTVTCEQDNYRISIGLSEPDAFGVRQGVLIHSNLTAPEDIDDEDSTEQELVHPSQATFMGAMHGLESFVLSAACYGIDIESKLFGLALFQAIESCANNLE